MQWSPEQYEIYAAPVGQSGKCQTAKCGDDTGNVVEYVDLQSAVREFIYEQKLLEMFPGRIDGTNSY